jgi:hypothetical protein
VDRVLACSVAGKEGARGVVGVVAQDLVARVEAVGANADADADAEREGDVNVAALVAATSFSADGGKDY